MLLGAASARGATCSKQASFGRGLLGSTGAQLDPAAEPRREQEARHSLTMRYGK